MDQERNQIILKKINNKGWNVYFRGKQDAKIDPEKAFERGPVETLENGVLYVILPKVEDPKDQRQTDAFINRHQVQPKIVAPTESNYLGRGIADFGADKTEYSLQPGEEIFFIGFILEDEEVFLLARSKTYMPHDIFQAALDSLQDITELEPVLPNT